MSTRRSLFMFFTYVLAVASFNVRPAFRRPHSRPQNGLSESIPGTSASRKSLPVVQKATANDMDLSLGPVVPVLVITALGLGIAAQSWINQQLEGDQGLGAFLNDGQGYKRSGFRPLTDGDRAASNDPLPWLSLPKLDFVEVAGQQSAEDKLMTELEELRVEMNEQLTRGNMAEATTIRNKLETRMRENGIEFQSDV